MQQKQGDKEKRFHITKAITSLAWLKQSKILNKENNLGYLLYQKRDNKSFIVETTSSGITSLIEVLRKAAITKQAIIYYMGEELVK